MAVFSTGEILVSGNPAVESRPQPSGGPARPELWQFQATNASAEPERILPLWQGAPAFSEHSYRSLAADSDAETLVLLQNIDYTHAEWSFRDSTESWSAGKLDWPRVASDEQAKPLRLCYPNVALHGKAMHFFGVSDVIEPIEAWRSHKHQVTGQEWDYVFRRLYYSSTPDITAQSFGSWIEIANVEATAGHLWPCDLWLGSDGKVHLLWTETALDERLRDAFFPDSEQARRLHYALLVDGKFTRRQILLESIGTQPGIVAHRARFHPGPGGRLMVVAYVTGQDSEGQSLSENRLMELSAEGQIIHQTRIPLAHPFSDFFTTTPRAGSSSSRYLDMLGTPLDKPMTIGYARVRIQ